MKCAIIHYDELQREMLSHLLLEVTQDAEITQFPEEYFDDPLKNLNLIKSGYDFIILPLSLPNFASLHIAQIAHLLRSPSRIILFSGTELSPEVTLRLFDDCWSYFYVSKATVEGTIKQLKNNAPERIHDEQELESAIESIISTAYCFDRSRYGVNKTERQTFNFRHSLLGTPQSEKRPPSMADYRLALKSPKAAQSDGTRFKTNESSNRAEEKNAKPQLFISYSHQDDEFRVKLEEHLSLLKHEGIVDSWHDRRIMPGTEWEEQIDARLRDASIIILLVTSAFMSSAYCFDKEMALAMERHEAGEAIVMPVIVRDVDWAGAPFAKLQAIPTGGKPVTAWRPQDRAWVDVVKNIRRAIELYKSRLQDKS